MEIFDLLNITKVHSTFVQPAIWSFRHFQAYKIIEISGRYFPASKGQNQQHNIRQGDALILIYSYEMTLEILNTFGTAIEKLDLDYQNMHPNELADIQRIIREKCAINLKHFGVSTNQPNYIDLIPSIFPNVESVSFMWIQLDIDINLNEKFPNMRSLHLSSVLSENGNIIDHHFPHLNKISFHLRNNVIGLNETHIERMLQKNAQIKSVNCKNPSQNFLQFLHENLPNMEALEVEDETKKIFSQNNRVIHFANVKQFTLHMDHRFFRDPEQFPFTFGDKLEEFKLIWCCDLFGSKWIEFFDRFANTPKLSIQFPGRCVEYPNLTELNFSNVHELRLIYIDLGVFRKIFKHIKQQQQLEMIHVIGIEPNDHLAIRNEINSDWEMDVLVNANRDDKIDVILTKIYFN